MRRLRVNTNVILKQCDYKYLKFHLGVQVDSLQFECSKRQCSASFRSVSTWPRIDSNDQHGLLATKPSFICRFMIYFCGHLCFNNSWNDSVWNEIISLSIIAPARFRKRCTNGVHFVLTTTGKQSSHDLVWRDWFCIWLDHSSCPRVYAM